MDTDYLFLKAFQFNIPAVELKTEKSYCCCGSLNNEKN